MKRYALLTCLAFTALFVLCFAFSGWRFGIISPDQIQHIRASYLIFSGQVPFRDFFEHHHLLLSYLLSPMFLFLHRDPIILLIARCYIYVFSVGCIFYGIHILDFLKTDKIFNRIFFPPVFCGFMFHNTKFFQFRPDSLMLLLFLMGIYYLFCFIRNSKIRNIQISFICFFVSFLSLQKIALFYPFLGIIILYIFVQKKYSIKNICISFLPVTVLVLGFISYLFITDSFLKYIACCFRVNMELASGICRYMTLKDFSTIPIALTLLSSFYLLYKNKDIYSLTLVTIFFVSFTSIYFCDPYKQYRIPMVCFEALLLTAIIPAGQDNTDKRLLNYASFLSLFMIFAICLYHYSKAPLNGWMKSYEKLLSKIGESETVSDEYRNFNIYNPTPYWNQFYIGNLNRVRYSRYGLPAKDMKKDIIQHKTDIINMGRKQIYKKLKNDYEEMHDYGFDKRYKLYRKKNPQKIDKI